MRLLIAFVFCIFAGELAQVCAKREAFVTLVYGETYALAARVLFQSIKETGTNKEIVALLLSDESNERMKVPV